MPNYLHNGIGFGKTGDSLATVPPLLTTGNVWYVSSLNGVDGPPPAGLNPPRPLKTLRQAIANIAASGTDEWDIVALGAQHYEEVSTPIVLGTSVTIVGCESLGGRPWPTLRRTAGSVAMFQVNAENVQIRGIQLFDSLLGGAGSAARVEVTGPRFRMAGCQVWMSQHDQGPAVLLHVGADGAQFDNCVFTARRNGTDPGAPDSAIKTDADFLYGVRMVSCTFDAGEIGFSNFYAADLSFGIIYPFQGERLSLLNGADMKLHGLSMGYVNVEHATGGSRVDW